jgi:hypothetical protein
MRLGSIYYYYLFLSYYCYEITGNGNRGLLRYSGQRAKKALESGDPLNNDQILEILQAAGNLSKRYDCLPGGLQNRSRF